jgi:hypothetical protein
VVWKRDGQSHTIVGAYQASYTVDNKPVRSMKWRPLGGNGGMAPFILNLRARHTKWSTSYCSQPLCQCLGVIASDTHWIGGWMDFRMTFAPAGIRTPDHPAHSVIAILTTQLPPYKKTQVQCGWQTVVNFIITDVLVTKLWFKKMKFFLCMPWGHVLGGGGTAPVILNLDTLPTFCVWGRASETHSPWGWLRQEASFDVNWTRICI